MQPIKTGAWAPYRPVGRRSRLALRLPLLEVARPHIVVLGGSATLGKGVSATYPALLQAECGVPVATLAAPNGGPDVYLSDTELLRVIARADMAVVQLTGAEAVTNPYYAVHPHRNDRVLAATPALRALFPEVDLADIHFARHLLQVLAETDAARCARVVRALKATWVSRMQQLLVHLPMRRSLLWIADRLPPAAAEDLECGQAPPFVDSGMLARLRPLAGKVVVAVPDASEAAPGPNGGSAALPGPMAHRLAAAALASEVRSRLPLMPGPAAACPAAPA